MRRSRPLPNPLHQGTLSLPFGDQTYVYRVYCACGTLLYVGMTNNLYRRFVGHHRDQERFPVGKFRWLTRAADRIEWALHDTRAEAERVERHLIRELRPRHNTIDALPPVRRIRWVDLPWPTPLTEHELQWRAICAARGTPFLQWLAEYRRAA